MLDGLFMLLSLSTVMAVASFLAGALPLSMSLSQSQLRLISAIGMGVLVGTSLIVIIPEGIEAVYTAGLASHTHGKRNYSVNEREAEFQWQREHAALMNRGSELFQLRDGVESTVDALKGLPGPVIPSDGLKDAPLTDHGIHTTAVPETTPPADEHSEPGPPTFYIGFALILGFILMFLIDKLPRHASENLQPLPPTRHISLDNLSQGLHRSNSVSSTAETEGFLQSLAPNPKQTRSLATTTGLVIHAAADGIAMGASASTANTKLGFIIFVAIMVHKAPAAFGLTSVLLKQGLSKRAARGHLIIFSLAAPFGALTTFILVHLLGGSGGIDGKNGQWWTGMLLLFSAGTFLYVAMHAMQEDGPNHDHSSSNGYAENGTSLQRKQLKTQVRDTFAAVAGMLLPLLTQIGHHH